MELSTTQIESVRNAFHSILRADYISISDIEQLKSLENYYVDYFKNLPKILQNQDNYINGRRGSGKTVLLMRAYYECLKSILLKNEKASSILQKKTLPIYIDLSQCKDIFSDDDEALLEQSFIRKLLEEFKSQLSAIFEAKKFKFLSKDFSKMNDFDQIQTILREGIVVSTSTSDTTKTSLYEEDDSVTANFSMDAPGIMLQDSSKAHYEQTERIQEKRGISVHDFLTCMGKIRRECKLDSVYVFIDEFSDLSEDEQRKFSVLLKKLLGSKNNIFFKVGTITDRFYFGESIIVGRDIFPISLDLNDFVERYGGITVAMKELYRFTKELIEKRISYYTENLTLNDIFRAEQKDQIFSRISKEAMGIPRTVGLILQNAFLQAETRDTFLIQVSDINIGIREARKIYFRQFQGAVQKRIIPGYYMDMWNALLKRALDEKNKVPNRPASHFMIDTIRKKYLNIFCENFLIHCLEDSRASKYGGNYVLFAFDY